MDAPNPSALPTFASRTPLHVGAVGLKVRDLDRLSQFYRDVLGLSVLDHDKNGATLGAGGVPVIHLEHQPGAKPDDPRTAGLYHTAFLMPTRADLARWILHVARHKVPLTGASDHGVSEAFYLDDPEGNGMEVYSDRPADSWQWIGNELKMITDPLDIDDILREVPPAATYPGAPEGLRIGHVHLRVGDIARAETFYRDALGLEVTRRRHGASFMSSGRYHHHIAGNVWHSAGAGPRDENRAGLSWLSLEAADDVAFEAVRTHLAQAGLRPAVSAAGIETADPWGTRLRVSAPSFRERTDKFQRLGGESPRQFTGRQRAPKRRRLPRPHRGKITGSLRLRPCTQRCERAGGKGKRWRHVRHRTDLSHHPVDDPARRAAGHQIGQSGTLFARGFERGAMRLRNLRFRAPEIDGADLHAGGAERERCRDAARIGDGTGGDDRNPHGIDDLRN